MCKDCGCGDHTHDHDPSTPSTGLRTSHSVRSGQVHSHDHEHSHKHDHERTITLEQKILSKNDELAEQNRQWLKNRGVVAINIISSPGSGKTFLLERTLERLRGSVPCAVITGDLQTDRDAQRLQNKGALVCQIETISGCHLDAHQISHELEAVTAGGAKILFIENVGNLVCPAAFDLGENFKIALLSTTEGEDKPVKYPTLFSSAPVVVLTKMDLVPHLDWDVRKCREFLQNVHPGVFVFELSAKTGQGMDAWIDYLKSLVVA